MRTTKRSRKSTKISTWPLALAIVLAIAIYTHPVIGLVIALSLAGCVIGTLIVASVYAFNLWRGKVKPPARITRDRKNERWSVEFL